MNKILITTLILALSLIQAVQAELSSQNYKIPALVINIAGGATEMQSVNYKLLDSKGFYGGVLSDGTIAQLGPIYVLVPAVPPEVPPVVEGPVTLDIIRDGSNIKLTWTINPPNDPNSKIDLYLLTADGTGKYSEDINSWIKVVENNSLVAPPLAEGLGAFELRPQDKILFHVDEVGKGIPEVYYKAIITGTPKADPDKGLPASAAVGKFNINIQPGYNLISIPFAHAAGENTLVNVFGAQLHGGTVDTADRIYTKDNSASWGMPNAYLGADGKWYWSNQPAVEANLAVDPRNGYLVRNKGGQVPITVVGRIASTQIISLTPGYNMIGTVFPINSTLNGLGIFGLGNVTSGNVANADRIYLKDVPASWGMPNAYLGADGKWYWSNQPAVGADFTLQPPRGYFYRMKGAGTINWERKLP